MTEPRNSDRNGSSALPEEVHPASERAMCGVVMPISAIDGCNEQHWKEVGNILFEAIASAGLQPRIVSDGNEVGVIQQRIVQNLYDDPIVVVDVSGKNPNVMFELGLRLAFDKPTIIVKDDKTTYSFDTGLIEHLGYPRDLRYASINDFKMKLMDKLTATLEKAKDPQYTTFLKHFKSIVPSKIERDEVPGQEFILKEVQRLAGITESLDRKFGALKSESDFDARSRAYVDAFWVRGPRTKAQIELAKLLSSRCDWDPADASKLRYVVLDHLNSLDPDPPEASKDSPTA